MADKIIFQTTEQSGQNTRCIHQDVALKFLCSLLVGQLNAPLWLGAYKGEVTWHLSFCFFKYSTIT